jgi:hypothetical protein
MLSVSNQSQTFAPSIGTPFYRRQYPAELISQVVSLLGHGCPLDPIVAIFELDEPMVADW